MRYKSLGVRCRITLIWMPHNLTNEILTLVSVMASLFSSPQIDTLPWCIDKGFVMICSVKLSNGYIMNITGNNNVIKHGLRQDNMNYILKNIWVFYCFGSKLNRMVYLKINNFIWVQLPIEHRNINFQRLTKRPWMFCHMWSLLLTWIHFDLSMYK